MMHYTLIWALERSFSCYKKQEERSLITNSTAGLHVGNKMQRVARRDMIKTWLHRAGMVNPPLPCKHTAATASTHTLVWLYRLLTHAPGSWLLATRLSRSAFPQHRKPIRQACGAAWRASVCWEHRSAGPIWTEPGKFTLGDSGLQRKTMSGLHHITHDRAPLPVQGPPLLWNGSQVQILDGCHMAGWMVRFSEHGCLKTTAQIWGVFILEAPRDIWVFNSFPHQNTCFH